MKNRILLVFVLCAITAVKGLSVNANGATPKPYSSVVIDGLKYEYYTSVSRDYVCVKAASKTITKAIIQPTVTLDGIECSVTDIQYGGFEDCSKLKSIELGNSIEEIGFRAFENCTSLSSITITSSVKNIGYSAFSGCSSLQEVIFDGSSQLENLGSTVFAQCTRLTKIVIPESVNNVGARCFWKDTKLESVVFEGADTELDSRVFEDCISLKSVQLPKGLKSIPEGLFYKCSGLSASTLEIPGTVTSIGESAFYGAKIERLLFFPKLEDYSSFSKIGAAGVKNFYVYSSEIAKIKAVSTRIFLPIDLYPDFDIKEIGAYYTRIKFCVERLQGAKSLKVYFDNKEIVPNEEEIYWLTGLVPDNTYSVKFIVGGEIKEVYFSTGIPYTYFGGDAQSDLPTVLLRAFKWYAGYTSKDEYDAPSEMGARLNVVGSSDYMYFVADKNNRLSAEGLEPATTYEVVFFSTYNGKRCCDEKYIYKYTTLTPVFKLEKIAATQSTLTLRVSTNSDESGSPKEVGVKLNGMDLLKADKNGIVKLTGLNVNNSYLCYAYAIYDKNVILSDPYVFRTESLDPQIHVSSVTPSTVLIRGFYNIGDYNIVRTVISCNGYESKEGKLQITGLEPEKSYYAHFYLYDDKGFAVASQSINITTPAIKLETLQPKGVSERCSIVAATTNISEEETNVGFQWKKYDAPESLKPSEGYAAIYDGQLEGYIKNLQPTSYYNVRAFYKSAAGNYYYGDWVTFDPSDFSYFEPTVHSYEATDVTATSANVKGYVLAGTDAITEQGFEYWTAESSASKVMRVNAMNDNSVSATDSDIYTVLATGQVMTATLVNLKPSTTYHYRSFVKTVSGTTYGEEQEFTTVQGPTGIDNVEQGTTGTTVEGYYDLSGRKIETLHRGVNIIRYSDGFTRKVLVK